MKFLLFLIPLLLSSQDDIATPATAFNSYYAPWYRQLLGCEPEETNINNCNPSLGKMDYQLFEKSRDEAKKLYKLRD